MDKTATPTTAPQAGYEWKWSNSNIVGQAGWVQVLIYPHKEESVNHPNHYGGDTTYEVIKVIHAWELDFDLGNAVKYIARAGKKDPAKELEDLEKAQWYIDSKIKLIKECKK